MAAADSGDMGRRRFEHVTRHEIALYLTAGLYSQMLCVCNVSYTEVEPFGRKAGVDFSLGSWYLNLARQC